MGASATIKMSEEDRGVIQAWLREHSAGAPEPVQRFLDVHARYLSAGGDMARRFDSSCKELRRALGITPSSE